MSAQPQNPFNYVPTEAVTIAFVSLFGLTTAVHLFQACWHKKWFLIPTLVLCGIGEIIGWSGRLWGSINPYNSVPFLMQISTLIISPSFMTAAIFSLWPQIIHRLGTEYSRLTPKYYNYIFISADFFALIVQAAGGGIASSATDNAGTSLGANIMLAGIVIQLGAVIIFALCAAESLIRYNMDKPLRAKQQGETVNVQAKEFRSSNSLPSDSGHGKDRWRQLDQKLFLMVVGICLVVGLVVIRSVYRTIELSDGWHGTVIETQWLFDVFDGVPIFLSLLTLNVLHPGWLLHASSKSSSTV